MRILLVTGTNIMGGEYHRLIIPHAKMFEQGYEVSQMTSIDHVPESQLKEFDLIVASRALSRIGNDVNLWKVLKRIGIPVIIDTDDHYRLSHDHIIKRDWDLNRRAETLIYNFKQADAVTTTNQFLRDELKQFNNVVEILPNVIDFEQPQFIPNKDITKLKTNLTHVGWSGSVTHLKDLEMIEPELYSLNKSMTKDYKLMLAGYYEGDLIWDKYEKIFTSNYHLNDDNYGRINAADVYSYAQAYNLFDIGLIPLRDNSFNRAKSDLKLLEMGAFGLPVIVSNVLPYQLIGKDKINCLFADKKDWYKSIRKLIHSPSMQTDLGLQLKEDVVKLRSEKLWRNWRIDFYESIINKKNNI